MDDKRQAQNRTVADDFASWFNSYDPPMANREEAKISYEKTNRRLTLTYRANDEWYKRVFEVSFDSKANRFEYVEIDETDE